MNKQLSYLTSLFGASGSEGDVRQAIINEIRDLCERVEVDPMGNVVAFKRGSMEAPFTLMLSAHKNGSKKIFSQISKLNKYVFY